MVKVSTKNNYFNSSFYNYYPVGFEIWLPTLETPAGFFPKIGLELSRDDNSNLFCYAVNKQIIVSEDEWQTKKRYGLYSFGDGYNTFRIPDERGLSQICFEEGYHQEIGSYLQDQIVNITGETQVFCDGTVPVGGAMYKVFMGQTGAAGSMNNLRYNIVFDASRVVNTGDRVQTRGITGMRYIKY